LRLKNPPLPPAPEILTTQQAAAFLQVSSQFLEIARVKGDGPPFSKVGRMVRYQRSTLRQWLRQQQRRSTSETNP
jgi:hypothetical protein